MTAATEIAHDLIPLALTFDDVLLVPQYSSVLPRQVSTATALGAGFPLALPLISAAMDTVTEHRLAVALAREGGLGVIHKNMSIDAQARQVSRVKKSESGLILDPITLTIHGTVGDARRLMQQHHISGIPVVDGERLAGIVTARDLRFEPAEDEHRPVSDVMTKAPVTIPEGALVEDAKRLFKSHRIEKLPVVDAAGNLRGLLTLKDIEQSLRYPTATKDALGRLRVGAAVGVAPDTSDRAAALCEAGADLLAVDTAHGYTESVLKLVGELKTRWPSVFLLAGNVATASATRALLDAGADAVKVGIGPGSICTTRVVAGVGVPQLSAVMDCAREAARRGTAIVADGGIRQSGDVVKALGAGAAVVMVGSLFAGTDEAPGETVLYQGRTYKAYRGMGSLAAMQEGSADRYFQEPRGKLVPEGVEGMVPYKGALAGIVDMLSGGLRSGMGYLGAKDLAALRERAQFVRVTAAGIAESHVHDVTVLKDAPNYSTSPR